MKKLNNLYLYRRIIAVLGLLAVFISCKSTPAPPDWEHLEETNFPLDNGASVYIFANVEESRRLIDLIPLRELQDRQTRQMLDKTDYFAAAFFPQQNTRNLQLQLAAWGNYPKFWTNFAFAFNKNWKKQKTPSGESYWYSGANGLSISLDSRQAFVVSSRLENAPSSPMAVSPFIAIPEGFDDFRSGAGDYAAGTNAVSSPLSCWLNDPAPMFSQILNNLNVPLNFPVQQLFINLYPSGERYEAVIRLQFENTIQARGAGALISIAGNFSIDDPMAVILFSNPPVTAGNNVDIKTPVLSDSEISLLLGMFLLYLN